MISCIATCSEDNEMEKRGEYARYYMARIQRVSKGKDKAKEMPISSSTSLYGCAASYEELCVYSARMVDLHLLHFEGIKLFLDPLRQRWR